MIQTIGFHYRNALFAFKEQFSNAANGLAGLLLFPFFMLILSKLWEKFNGYQGNYAFKEILAYVGVTEILFMSFLRSANVALAAGDFSISLSRPRSWLMMQGSSLFGRVLGTRLIYVVFFVPMLLLFGHNLPETGQIVARLLILLPLLGVVQALYSLVFSCAQVRWELASFLMMPFGKIFLVFGGVFAPLSDFSEGSRNILIRLPPADIFFQPAYFCIRGSFYGMSSWEWLLRVFLQIFVLALVCHFYFRYSRKFHQSIGG